MKLIFTMLFLMPTLVWATQDNCKITFQQDFPTYTSGTTVLSEHATRKCLIIQNKGTNNSQVSYIKFGSAQTGFEGMQIGFSTSFIPIVAPTSKIFLKTQGSGFSTTVIEGF